MEEKLIFFFPLRSLSCRESPFFYYRAYLEGASPAASDGNDPGRSAAEQVDGKEKRRNNDGEEERRSRVLREHTPTRRYIYGRTASGIGGGGGAPGTRRRGGSGKNNPQGIRRGDGAGGFYCVCSLGIKTSTARRQKPVSADRSHRAHVPRPSLRAANRSVSFLCPVFVHLVLYSRFKQVLANLI